jgi:hypothetical protein
MCVAEYQPGNGFEPAGVRASLGGRLQRFPAARSAASVARHVTFPGVISVSVSPCFAPLHQDQFVETWRHASAEHQPVKYE